MAANERFNVSTGGPELKAHAQATGLDVTRYVTPAAQKQVQDDDIIARRFAEVDAAIAATEAMAAPAGAAVEVGEVVTATALAGIAHALAPPSTEAAPVAGLTELMADKRVTQ